MELRLHARSTGHQDLSCVICSHTQASLPTRPRYGASRLLKNSVSPHRGLCLTGRHREPSTERFFGCPYLCPVPWYGSRRLGCNTDFSVCERVRTTVDSSSAKA